MAIRFCLSQVVADDLPGATAVLLDDVRSGGTGHLASAHGALNIAVGFASIVIVGRVNTSAAVPTKAKKKRGGNHSLEHEYSQLKEENRKLLDLAEWRSASMAHLAHELRTQLTSILGFSEILLSQEQ